MKKICVGMTALLLCSGMFVTSCNDDDNNTIVFNGEDTVQANKDTKIFVLNQGSWGQGNASLTQYNLEKKEKISDFFYAVNNRHLGDNAQDMKVYGNQLWITVNGENTVEVVNPSTGVSIKQLSISQPRYVTFYGNHAYVTRFDGYLARIDTASFAIDSVSTGLNPENVCIANNKIYVANSGGLNYPIYEKTISIFSLDSMRLLDTKEVVVNPSKIVKVDEQTLLLYSYGDYAAIPGSLQKINTVTDEITYVEGVSLYNLDVKGRNVYYYNTNWDGSNSEVGLYDLSTETIVSNNFTTDTTTFKNPYAIETLANGMVAVSDAISYEGVNGIVYLYDEKGNRQADFEVEVNPCAIVSFEK